MKIISFSSKERVGIICLIALCIIVMLVGYFHKEEFPDTIPQTHNFKKTKTTYTKKAKTTFRKAQQRFTYFQFDPNTISTDSLLLMGFTQKQSQVIDNYRLKGGRFKHAKDFSKIYCITPSMFEKLEPFIKIYSTRFKKHFYNKKTTNKAITLKININNATVDELIQLPMIGTKRAEAIIRYRQTMGGFYSLSQIKEIRECYYLNVDSCLSDRVIIDPSLISKIDINTADYTTIKQHPYFKFYTIKKILDYRKLKGEIFSPRELLTNKILDSSVYFKIEPYLKTVNSR